MRCYYKNILPFSLLLLTLPKTIHAEKETKTPEDCYQICLGKALKVDFGCADKSTYSGLVCICEGVSYISNFAQCIEDEEDYALKDAYRAGKLIEDCNDFLRDNGSTDHEADSGTTTTTTSIASGILTVADTPESISPTGVPTALPTSMVSLPVSSSPSTPHGCPAIGGAGSIFITSLTTILAMGVIAALAISYRRYRGKKNRKLKTKRAHLAPTTTICSHCKQPPRDVFGGLPMPQTVVFPQTATTVPQVPIAHTAHTAPVTPLGPASLEKQQIFESAVV
ncbi:hypothetical protein ABW19_dt0207050 [Dactylella cylindrospora]|nr:hypothetical protein ABW19_dt0207050 [Dactylella cylindrospora]